VHLRYPGEVPCSGGGQTPAKSWADYALAFDDTNGDAQMAVWNDFWVSILITLYESVILYT
jgi:hypothetical protein